MQILHGGRYAYHPLAVAPSALKSPITPFRPRALTGWGVRRTIAAYARCAVLARRAGYDGVEIMGSEGYLINQFVAPQTNLRDDDWGGSFLQPHPLPGRDRASHARSGRPELHHHLPPVDARSGRRRQLVGRGRRAGAGGRSRRRDDHQHRHRLARGAHPDDRDDGAARRVHLGDAAPEGRGQDSADHDQSHQRSRHRRSGARARRRRHGVDGAAVPRRRRLCRQGGAGSRRRNQYLHRLQPGLPRPDFRAADGDLPGQPVRLSRDRARVHAGARPGARVAVVGAGPAGMACATDGGRARPRREPVRRRGGDRRPVQSRAPHSGQGGIRRDAALFSRAACAAGRQAATRSSCRRAGPAGLRRGDSRLGHRAAARRRFPASRTPRSRAMSTSSRAAQRAGRRVAIIGAGGIGFDVAELLTRRAIRPTAI